jgi:hypothetical protein
MGRSPAEVAALFGEVVGAANVRVGDDAGDDYTHDEALTATPQRPLAVVSPGRRRRSPASCAWPTPNASR